MRSWIWSVVGLAIGFAFLGVYIVSAPTKPDSVRVVAQQGYTQVKSTGFRFFGCGRGDWYHTGFTAAAPNGDRVSGLVCEGFFKGKTVRFD